MRVLLVEDEPEFAAAVRGGLVADGWVVDVVSNGRDGLQRALTGGYAAIVLDLMLPGLSGYSVLDHLRRAAVTTPVLVLTAKDGEVDQTDALDGGADDFLTKPVSYAVLVARLRALVRRERGVGTARNRLVVGDIELDLRRHRCRRADRDVALTPREFALLEVLASRPGETVGKREILLQAWPGETDDVNLVEVRVSALRRKLDHPFDRHSLETVRGVGYRLVADG